MHRVERESSSPVEEMLNGRNGRTLVLGASLIAFNTGFVCIFLRSGL